MDMSVCIEIVNGTGENMLVKTSLNEEVASFTENTCTQGASISKGIFFKKDQKRFVKIKNDMDVPFEYRNATPPMFKTCSRTLKFPSKQNKEAPTRLTITKNRCLWE
jgi:hypothetical protein